MNEIETNHATINVGVIVSQQIRLMNHKTHVAISLILSGYNDLSIVRAAVLKCSLLGIMNVCFYMINFIFYFVIKIAKHYVDILEQFLLGLYSS